MKLETLYIVRNIVKQEKNSVLSIIKELTMEKCTGINLENKEIMLAEKWEEKKKLDEILDELKNEINEQSGKIVLY